MNIEFFHHDSNLTVEQDLVKVDKEYQLYSMFATKMNAHMFIMLALEEEKTAEVIIKMRNDGIKDPVKIMTQFIRCNLSILDKIPDIEENGKINIEYVPCQFKKASEKCPFSRPGDPTPYCIYKKQSQVPIKHGYYN